MAKEQFTGKGEEFGHEVGSTIKEQAEKASERAGEIGSSFKQQGEKAMERAGEVASEVGERANTAVAAVGGQMKGLAGRVRERAPQEGMIGTAAEKVARGLETGGEYLEEHNLRDIAEDASDLVRNYPIPSILVCIGLGFLIGRTLRS
jgi:ElaB/YqjD/DUF883 family membrane-anchored ribosome-binding protein